MMMILQQLWGSHLEWVLNVDDLFPIFQAVFSENLDAGFNLDGLSAADFEAIISISNILYPI